MRITQRVFLLFFIIFIINGMTCGYALAADRNVIIGFHKADIPSEEKLVKDYGGKLKKTFHVISAVSANMSDENITKLKNDPRVSYVETDSAYKITDEYTNTWGVSHIGSQPVYDSSVDGTGVKIAVLDTGIYYAHEDIGNNYKGGIDIYNNDSDPFDDNCQANQAPCHGTHVSGTIAAKHNGIGVVGVAPGAGIYAVKVAGAAGDSTTSYIISGIEWAMANNMNIVTTSIACTPSPLDPCDSIALNETINNAYNSGILIIASAGNTHGSVVAYPAIYPNAVAVTATDENDQRASFSPIDPKIELAAPGVNINSTKCIWTSICVASTYGLLSGTSMAAPHVAGVAALIMSSTKFKDINGDGNIDGKDVRLILQQTARDIGTPGRDNIYGFGIVDASNATLGIPYTSPVPVVSPKIMNSTPASPVNDSVGASRTFNITTDQIVNVTWYINGTQVGSINGVTNAQYTNNSASSGIRNVTVMASNINGSVMSSWKWNVTPVPVPPPVSTLNFTLKRTKASPTGDTQKVNLSQGKYLININNVNLTEVEMKVYKNGVLLKSLSKYFEFSKNHNAVSLYLTVNNATIAFVPYGKSGSIGYVIIKTL